MGLDSIHPNLGHFQSVRWIWDLPLEFSDGKTVSEFEIEAAKEHPDMVVSPPPLQRQKKSSVVCAHKFVMTSHVFAFALCMSCRRVWVMRTKISGNTDDNNLRFATNEAACFTSFLPGRQGQMVVVRCPDVRFLLPLGSHGLGVLTRDRLEEEVVKQVQNSGSDTDHNLDSGAVDSFYNTPRSQCKFCASLSV